MKGKNIERVSERPEKIPRQPLKDLTDWNRVKSMTEEEIERNALEDPDALPFDDDWEDATIVYPNSDRND